MSLETPAKVNLFLGILGRREDGYHEVETLLLPISLTDRVTVSLDSSQKEQKGQKGGTKFQLVIDGEKRDVPEDDRNLAWKAAKLFLEGEKEGKKIFPKGGKKDLTITLTKRIPVAAGLGGGSSDAAAVLRILSKKFPSYHSEEEIKNFATKLGADVPFFLDPAPAWYKGRGDLFWKKISLARPLHLVVAIHAGLFVETRFVYQRFAESQKTSYPEGRLARLCDALHKENLSKIADRLFNHLEEVTLPSLPQVADLKNALLDYGAVGALMSGSGPAVFGIFPDEASARQAAASLSKGIKSFYVLGG